MRLIVNGVGRELAGDGVGGTARAAKRQTGKLDIVARGPVGQVADKDGARGGEAGEEGEDVGELHGCV